MEQIMTCAGCGSSQEVSGPAKPVAFAGRVIIALDRIIYRVAKHWLFVANSVFFVHVMTIILAPAFVAWGHPGLARPIYGFNGLFCHQRADRSFFVLGEKMACCERCAAIYGSIMLAGLLFAMFRGRIRRPRVHEIALMSLPILVDTGVQALGLWESTPGSRVLSGVFFGVAVCWWILPYFESGFARMRLQIETLFARLVSQERALPL